MALRPIGYVRSPVEGHKYGEWEEVVAEIEVVPELEEALSGLEEFSHLVVLFWLDRAEAPSRSRIHPEGRPELPLVGYLATRTPNRLNPIGLTVVRLLERKGRVLVVQGLDAFDGTAVIDVKPYLPPTEPAEAYRVPPWVHRLRAERPPKKE
jgi:tRNA-Thr(GGU) m(6)t(6)A37 methyltransferase TsaA